MTTSEDSTHLDLHVDEMAARKTCSICGAVLRADHGIIHMTEDSGVTWWQCPKGHRFKEDYRFEWDPDRKITLSIVEV